MSVAIVIPVYNMATHLENLLRSIWNSGLIDTIDELIIFDDGSTDGISEVLGCFTSPKIKLLRPDKNVGRYLARYEGALSVQSESILFLDARVEVMSDFVKGFDKVKHMSIVQGTIDIPADESIYSLYWELSHKRLFNRHYQDKVNGFWLTNDNYEQYTSGTTIFYVKKDIFINACHSFITPPACDDRELIRKIVKNHDIWLTEKLKVNWRPRQNLKNFLGRLLERGPVFVEYHFYDHKTKFRKGVYLGLFVIFSNLVMMLLIPHYFFSLMIFQLFLILLSTVFFAGKTMDFFKLCGLHTLVVLAFGLGVLWGLVKTHPKCRRYFT